MRVILKHLLLVSATCIGSINAFLPVSVPQGIIVDTRLGDATSSSSTEQEDTILKEQQEQQRQELAAAAAAEKFKVVTCMSTSCSQKRKTLGMDSLATFGALYSRAKDGCFPTVQVEEGPCLGSCKNAPCVAIEHDDFVGSVSLEGMDDDEFSSRV